jgi:hypothetical protein
MQALNEQNMMPARQTAGRMNEAVTVSQSLYPNEIKNSSRDGMELLLLFSLRIKFDIFFVFLFFNFDFKFGF